MRDEEHFARPPRQRPRREAVKCLFNDQTLASTQRGQPRRRVKSDAVLAPRSAAGLSPESGVDAEHPGKRVERPLLSDKSAVLRLPPVARKEARHHSVAASPVPDENSSRLENAGEFNDHAGVVRWIVEKPERCEQIHDAVKTTCPRCRQLSHVRAPVMQRRPAAALGGESEKLARVVDAVDAEAGFCQKMSVPSLPARRVENTRSHRQPEDFDYPSCLGARALRREYRIVFPEVLQIEIAFPPLGLTTQKNTGSR